jgi:hypothetical protein
MNKYCYAQERTKPSGAQIATLDPGQATTFHKLPLNDRFGQALIVYVHVC